MGSLYSPGKGPWDKPIHEHVNELDFLNVLSCEFDKVMKRETGIRGYSTIIFAGLITDFLASASRAGRLSVVLLDT